MKKIFTILFFLLIVKGNVNSQVLFNENFAYTAGDSIQAHGWVTNTGTTNPLLVSTPGLTFPGFPNSNIGNSLILRPTGYDAWKGFNQDSTGAIYTAFMVRIDSAKGTGDYFFALLPSTSTTNYTARTYAKDTTGGISFGISRGTVASGIGWSSTTYNYGTTYLLVVKYNYVAGNTNDEVSLFVFSTNAPLTEPVTPTVGPVTSTAGDAVNIGRVAVRQGTASVAPYLYIDGFRVTKTWAAIVTNVTTTSTVAESFALSQNYPNPFNPSTKINFSLPSAGKVTLKVYDALGKEVNSLVNNNLNTGTFEYNFNGSALNSGVYFYKLEFFGNDGKYFSDMKKMMLVK
ncbi:MAG TPA: T9SS type A sorting domain-containing protein [Ignavibacteria bacterium]|nr:T9SS type A sorting domain-containing protein [Ignavibacteria bacterium]